MVACVVGRFLLDTFVVDQKKNYRILDFRNAFYNIIGILIEIHYDPNRSAYIGLVNFVKIGLLSYVLLPDGLREGGKIFFL